MRKFTQEDFLEAVKKNSAYAMYDYSESDYQHMHTPVKIICKVHGPFMQKPYAHIQGRRCNKCVGGVVLTQKEFIDKVDTLFDGLYDYSGVNYKNSHTKVSIRCKTHGVFMMRPNDHLNGQECPGCFKTESKGEKKISQVLDSLGVPFEKQKRFDACRGKKFCLPFDFYLPEINTAIEFDGRQHSQVVEQFGGLDALLAVQKNDIIKNQFCVDNNIKLLRISHKDYKKIPQILLDYIHNSDI